MYTVTQIKINKRSFIALSNATKTSKAKICLSQGGRLSNLVFENIQILANLETSTYKNNYASAILFPFANRIKDGEYTFKNSKYKLDCNEKDKNNAIHGLVYDKTFTCTNKATTSDYGSVTLQYKNKSKLEGFPFKFNIELTYTLSKCGITLSIKVVNKSKKPFPFTLGWHPYFNSLNLNNSSINFKGSKKYLCDSQQIISGKTDLDFETPFKLNNVKLDDGYPLETNEIDFSTPEYCFNLRSSSKENFLQLYTPNQPNIIAIEPMTGAADNFNNKIGLQTLEPNQTYTMKWNMAILTLDTKLTN
ncbi:aldose 1-epimerase [Lacinutrix jangbogonensis]|uniref:aldose 1-epimerase n=1 Tax=Lacinutrix jangbogonensis TaxID=1469557 RepID=UPI00068C86DC|nr:aldose 1-epimerase [Lacinutrix jangbogonensis]